MRRSAGMQKGRPSWRSRRPRRSPGWRREVLLKQMPREGACEPPRSADSQGQEPRGAHKSSDRFGSRGSGDRSCDTDGRHHGFGTMRSAEMHGSTRRWTTAGPAM